MTEKTMPKGKHEDSLGENPSKPGRKLPSEGGVGSRNSRLPGDAEHSPTSKTL